MPNLGLDLGSLDSRLYVYLDLLSIRFMYFFLCVCVLENQELILLMYSLKKTLKQGWGMSGSLAV